MTQITQKQIDTIERKLAQLNALRPIPKPQLQKLQEHMRIEMTYNSNAIEGNSLTLKETYLVINEGITVKGKALKDHVEAKDHYEALEYLYDLIEHGKRHTISERFIRTIHQIIMQKTDKDWAGVYRNANVIIGGANHTPPDALNVQSKMSELMQWVAKNRKSMHVVELSACIHHKLVHIHPFFDGNGRTSRLVMNVLLMQYGLPMVIILKNDRKRYYNVLAKADAGNMAPLVAFIVSGVERSLSIYLKVLTPTSMPREHYMTLAQLAKKSQYDAKYLNKLARTGKLEAHKEGRIWVASVEALQRYKDARERKK